jgi:hypothetical protein
MTPRDWLRRWWGAAPAAPAGGLGRVVPLRPKVPSEYLSLYTYLEHRYATDVVLTFTQIETLLGLTLPAAASTEPAWWTTAASARGGRHADAWMLASRTATPNLGARTVTFERHA